MYEFRSVLKIDFLQFWLKKLALTGLFWGSEKNVFFIQTRVRNDLKLGPGRTMVGELARCHHNMVGKWPSSAPNPVSFCTSNDLINDST